MGHQAGKRLLQLVEPAAVFLLIMMYIWRLRYAHHDSWIPILGLIALSHRWHREEPESLGFRLANFRECLNVLSPALLFVALSLLSLGILLQTTRPITFDQGVMAFAAYCPWGLFQQYLLNGYFVNRFAAVSPARYVPLLSGALFCGVHAPNWFLMGVTFGAGYVCARLYLKYRNVYFLGLAHGAIGFLLFLVVPDSISHHLIVGPGWFHS